MGKKISNQARMIGVLPSQGADPIPVGKIPDDATQIAKSHVVQNGEVIIHTVTAGKIFYLTHYSFTPNSSVAGKYAQLRVRNDSDVVQYTITMVLFDAAGQATVPGTFIPPLEIAAGWDIFLYSNDGGTDARGFIHGYEA